jgi:hypothetical protein
MNIYELYPISRNKSSSGGMELIFKTTFEELTDD